MSYRLLLSRGQSCLIDDDDIEEITQHRWYFDGTYAARWEHRQKIYLHRVVNKTPAGMVTDHINRNRLDNRRINLRSCSQWLNIINRRISVNNKSGIKGVSWAQDRGRWRADICVQRHRINLGIFDTIGAAAQAYSRASRKYHVV